MPEPRWLKVAAAADLPPGARKRVRAAERDVLLVQLDDGELLAVDGRCPHQDFPLDQGHLAGRVLTCPLHGYCFDVRTGRCVQPPGEGTDLTSYPVEARGDELWLAVPAEE